jgi:hypothetical protein
MTKSPDIAWWCGRTSPGAALFPSSTTAMENLMSTQYSYNGTGAAPAANTAGGSR